MFNSTALEVVIGLVFIYLLYSLLATIIQEIVATKLNFRSKFLEKAVWRMLQDEDPSSKTNWFERWFFIFPRKKDLIKDGSTTKPDTVFEKFFGHPLIKFLGEQGDKKKPSYLKSETFSKVIIDLLKGDAGAPGDDIKAKITTALSNGGIMGELAGTKTLVKLSDETLRYLKSIWADASGDVEKFRAHLENWFDETMERTSGWYKKYTQLILIVIGLIIAIIFNVNTIEITGKLSKDPTLRQQMVAQAQAFVKEHPNLKEELAQQKQKTEEEIKTADSARKATVRDSLNAKTDSAYALLQRRGDSLQVIADSLVKKDLADANQLLGIGINTWKPKNICDVLMSMLGWLITALALSLGAPFWFDLLNKLMQLRTSVATGTDGDKKAADTKSQTVKRVG